MDNTISTIVFLVLFSISAIIVIRTLKKYKMHNARFLFIILFIISLSIAPLYFSRQIIGDSFGSIYQSESLLKTFVLMEMDWMAYPIAIFKTISIGTFMFSIVFISSITIIFTKTVFFLKKMIICLGDEHEEKNIVIRTPYYLDKLYKLNNRRIYLKLNRLLN